MKKKLTIQRNQKHFEVEVTYDESGRGYLTVGKNTVPCQLTKNTLDIISSGIWNTIICESCNMTDKYGQIMLDGGMSVLKINAIFVS